MSNSREIIINKIDSESTVGCGCLIIIAILCIGYFLNFQNLWQYWPNTTPDTTVIQWLSNASVRWVVSLIGVFFPPIGIITGWIW